MAYFLILADDHNGKLNQRIAFRDAHLEYWASKTDAVKVAGAMLDGDRPCGSSFLIEADDEHAARALLADDPFTTQGIFSGATRIVAVRPAIGQWMPTT